MADSSTLAFALLEQRILPGLVQWISRSMTCWTKVQPVCRQAFSVTHGRGPQAGPEQSKRE